jgi:hypothetical protein
MCKAKTKLFFEPSNLVNVIVECEIHNRLKWATLSPMTGRPKNLAPTRKAEPMLPADAYACLKRLAAMARYGSTPNEVARYLILRGLDDLTRARVLPSDDGDSGNR